MRITCSLFALVILAMNVDAQPTFTGSNLPTVGTRLVYTSCDTANVTPGASGANAVWDMSFVKVYPSTIDIEYVDPSQTPYATQFPTATLAEKSDTAWSYYRMNGNRWTRLGEESVSIQSGPWANPMDMAMVPWSFGESYSDDAFHTYTIQTSEFDREATVNGTFDAYGTLILPQGTFTNVIRLKYDRVVKDTTELVAGPFTIGFSTTVRTKAWIWFEEGDPQPLFELDSSTIVIVTTGPAPSIVLRTQTNCAITSEVPSTEPLDPPTQTSPADMSRVKGIEVKLEWQKSEPTNIVRVQISKDQDFSLIDFEVSGQLNSIVTDLELGFTYFWRVATIAGTLTEKSTEAVQEIKWSPTWSFTVVPETPYLISPENGGTLSGMPYWRWIWTATADSSDIQIAVSSDFTSPIVDKRVAGDEYWDVLPEGQYHWRTRGVALTGVVGDWTEPWAFTAGPTSVIELSSTDVTVGPNPASSLLTVNGSDVSNYQAYTIFTIDGTAVLRGRIVPGTTSLNVDISSLASSAYIVVLESATGITPIHMMVQR